MENSVLLFLALLLVIVCTIMLAKKIRVAYPVLLVIAGLLISFIPGLPKTELEPKIVFILFLPPLLYEAAWACSFRELFKWRRIILSFAFIVVFITAVSVAFTAYWFIPGFTLALGFFIGRHCFATRCGERQCHYQNCKNSQTLFHHTGR